ncbi:hypothetical protein D1872_168500 [compost metagenome]
MARRRYNRGGVYWGAFILEWFKYLQDTELSSADYRVLFFLCEIMKIDDNVAYVKQKEISIKLNMDKGNVSKCITKLREKQFIAKSTSGFMINPHLFYIGARQREIRENLREQFDSLLSITPRFNLNEDLHALEVGERNIFTDDADAPF